MLVQDNQFKLVRAMKVHVRIGPIGPAGMTVLLTAAVAPNQELEVVSTVQKGIVQGRPMMNNNAIDNPVMNHGQ